MIHFFKNYYIPERMMQGIIDYVRYGIQPGNFLTSIICNQLKQTFQYADDENFNNVPAYVDFFYNKAPYNCWGSEKIMKGWIKTGGTEGKNSKWEWKEGC